MKKRISRILMMLAVMLWMGIPVYAQNNAQLDYVTDDAGLLTAGEWEELETEAAWISETYGCGTYIYTLDDFTEYGYSDVEAFAKDVYRQFDLGWGGDSDGILLLLSMRDRDYALIAYGDFAHQSFTDYGKSRMEDHFLAEFGNDEWQDGFEAYLEDCEEYLELSAAGTPYDIETTDTGESLRMNLLWIIVVPCVISGVICLIFLSQMKAAVKQGDADAYVIENGIGIRIREDRFTHETVTRRKIETSSGSKGGGGTKVGRDGFSGSSGKF